MQSWHQNILHHFWWVVFSPLIISYDIVLKFANFMIFHFWVLLLGLAIGSCWKSDGCFFRFFDRHHWDYISGYATLRSISLWLITIRSPISDGNFVSSTLWEGWSWRNKFWSWNYISLTVKDTLEANRISKWRCINMESFIMTKKKGTWSRKCWKTSLRDIC